MKVLHYSPVTLKNYHISLTGFFGYLARAGVEAVGEIEPGLVRDYQRWIMQAGYADYTVVARLQAVRRFFEHLEATDIILLNPCAGQPLPKIGHRLPKAVLSQSEAEAVLKRVAAQ
jgi:integrase/recombinase XerD